ncbi:MAG: hypothetical protein O2854_06355 [Chloroflexi bacterium]|nr:hypothetical protein [Chloroflexota bacterium]
MGIEFATESLGDKIWMVIQEYRWLLYLVVAVLGGGAVWGVGTVANGIGKQYFGQELILPRFILWVFRSIPWLGRRIAVYIREQSQRPSRPLTRGRILALAGFLIAYVGLAFSIFFFLIEDTPNAYACSWQVQIGSEQGVLVEVGVHDYPTDGIVIESTFNRPASVAAIWEDKPLSTPEQAPPRLTMGATVVQLSIIGKPNNRLDVSVGYPSANLRRSVYFYFIADEYQEEPLAVLNGRIITAYEKRDNDYESIDRLSGCPSS